MRGREESNTSRQFRFACSKITRIRLKTVKSGSTTAGEGLDSPRPPAGRIEFEVGSRELKNHAGLVGRNKDGGRKHEARREEKGKGQETAKLSVGNVANMQQKISSLYVFSCHGGAAHFSQGEGQLDYSGKKES